MYYIYQAGQKVCSCFSITSYRKTQTNFLANQQYIKYTTYRYLTIITMLYFGSPGRIHLTAAGLCPLTILSPFLSPPPAPGKHHSPVCSVSSALWAISGTSSLVPRLQRLIHLPSQLGWCPLGESYTLPPPITVSILKMSGGKTVTC